jgi:hypothetical protein
MAAFAAPAIAAPATTPTTPSPTKAPAAVPTPEQLLKYPTLRSMGRVKHVARPPMDPKNPTWQDYQEVSYNARWVRHDLDKADKYQMAAYTTLVKSIEANPNQKLSKKDQLFAADLCVNKMCADATAIETTDLNKFSDAKELEELVEQQQQHFGVLRTSYSVLQRISPSSAAHVAFELPKASAVMAKTKDKLEKIQAQTQAQAKSDTKTE